MSKSPDQREHTKADRRAAALRENLKRRKAQARGRAQPENDPRGRAQAVRAEKTDHSEEPEGV